MLYVLCGLIHYMHVAQHCSSVYISPQRSSTLSHVLTESRHALSAGTLHSTRENLIMYNIGNSSLWRLCVPAVAALPPNSIQYVVVSQYDHCRKKGKAHEGGPHTTSYGFTLFFLLFFTQSTDFDLSLLVSSYEVTQQAQHV